MGTSTNILDLNNNKKNANKKMVGLVQKRFNVNRLALGLMNTALPAVFSVTSHSWVALKTDDKPQEGQSRFLKKSHSDLKSD